MGEIFNKWDTGLHGAHLSPVGLPVLASSSLAFLTLGETRSGQGELDK